MYHTQIGGGCATRSMLEDVPQLIGLLETEMIVSMSTKKWDNWQTDKHLDTHCTGDDVLLEIWTRVGKFLSTTDYRLSSGW